jgi:uncharacterized protein (UPF0212 family)
LWIISQIKKEISMEYQFVVVARIGFWRCDKCNADHYQGVSYRAHSALVDIDFCDKDYAIRKIERLNGMTKYPILMRWLS